MVSGIVRFEEAATVRVASKTPDFLATCWLGTLHDFPSQIPAARRKFCTDCSLNRFTAHQSMRSSFELMRQTRAHMFKNVHRNHEA